jgi:hypothetical protein
MALATQQVIIYPVLSYRFRLRTHLAGLEIKVVSSSSVIKILLLSLPIMQTVCLLQSTIVQYLQRYKNILFLTSKRFIRYMDLHLVTLSNISGTFKCHSLSSI